MASDAGAATQDYAANTPDTHAKRGNPLRSVALAVLLLACMLFVLAVVMERRTPSTSQATVSAYIVGIAPEIAGRVIEAGVTDNSAVEPGQTLFRIDPEQYQIAATEAEARLAGVGQSIGASTAAVDSAQAGLVEAKADRDNFQEHANRAMELVKRGVYSKAKFDEAKAALDQANASVTAAEADLKRAQEELGPAGIDDPQLREALAALERAQLDLLCTTPLFLFLVVLLAGLALGGRAALNDPAAKLYAGALTIFLVVFGTGVSPLPGAAAETLSTRVAYILMAIVYTLFMAALLWPRSKHPAGKVVS